MTIKRFKQSQKFRIIVGQACFYVTAKQIRNGIGDFSIFNAAAQKCLDAFEFQRSGKDVLAFSTGLAGVWSGVSMQMDIA